MHKKLVSAAVAAGLAISVLPGTANSAEPSKSGTEKKAGSKEIERGRYMIVTGHCNNCHTAGYSASQGNVPEKDWLQGNSYGYRLGPGTSYSSNLRLTVQNYTETEWVKYAKTAKPRPPMPWWSLHETTEQDLRAMYKFIRHLGPAGQPAKPFVPADQEPEKPYEVRQMVK